MYQRAKQFTLERPRLKRVVGVVLILIGVIGVVTPLLPGLVFIVIGLELFGIRLLFIDRAFERVMQKKHIPVEK